jgi:hypothetical protein
MFPNRIAWAIGGDFCRSVKPVVGALLDVTNVFGIAISSQDAFGVCANALGMIVPHFLQVRASSFSKNRL